MKLDPFILLFVAVLCFWLALILFFAGRYVAGVVMVVIIVWAFIGATKLIKRNDNDKA